MIKAINLSTYQYDMDRYNNNYKNVNKFLEDNNINAIELFGLQLYNEELIPKDKIIGAHLMHYPGMKMKRGYLRNLAVKKI